MHSDIVIKDHLGSFKSLSDEGVKNFFTYDNERWGNMSLASNPAAVSKIENIFKTIGISASYCIYLGPDGNDSVQVITDENLSIYKFFNTMEIRGDNSNLQLVKVISDAFITKLSIPFIVTPADCAIVAITGIDQKDDRRFIMFVHSGFSGAILEIVKKTVKIAHTFYAFDNKDLTAAVFPYVGGKYYRKENDKIKHNEIIDINVWEPFLKVDGELTEIYFGKKLLSDLASLGITDIFDSGVDTYEAHKNDDTLFSYTYEKEIEKDRDKRFLVGASL